MPEVTEVSEELNLSDDDITRLRKASTEIGSRVFILEVTFNRPGTRKCVQKDSIIDPQYLKESENVEVSKRVMNWPEYRAIAAFESSVRDRVKSLSCRHRKGHNIFKAGSYPVPKENVRRVLEFLRERKPVFESLVMDLVRAFPERKAEDKKRHGRLFRDSDYPSVVRLNNMFGMDWGLTVIDTAGALNSIQQDISDEIFAEETERARTRVMSFAASLEQGLAAAVSEAWHYVWDRFNPETTITGKQKSIKSDAMANLIETVKELRNLNITGNTMLEEQIDKLEEVISMPVELMKKNHAVRSNIYAEAKVALDALDTVLIDKPTRRISIMKSA